MTGNSLFSKNKKTLVACIHLAALPGAPTYGGSIDAVSEQAVAEAKQFEAAGVDGLIIENFNDAPFYPGAVPSETVAAMTRVISDIASVVSIPFGVNVLRNDGVAALSIAAACGASFVRVNILTGAALADQGIIQGDAHTVLRHKTALGHKVQLCADVQVKHAVPLAPQDLIEEAHNCITRGRADALIVSGTATGQAPNLNDVTRLSDHCDVPLIVGSGVIPERLSSLLPHVDGLIVGSVFKTNGDARKAVDADRLQWFMDAYRQLL